MWLFVAGTMLFILCILLFGYSMQVLPAEGVKLRGTVDTGVDLLGMRSDIWWIAAFASLVYVGNTTIAILLYRYERVASLFLLAALIPLLLLTCAAIISILLLNAEQV